MNHSNRTCRGPLRESSWTCQKCIKLELRISRSHLSIPYPRFGTFDISEVVSFRAGMSYLQKVSWRLVSASSRLRCDFSVVKHESFP